jgi:hypothetical protein
MSPRILRLARCPHCRSDLSQPTPRMCPHCGGSLQKRFLTAGCLTSAPPIVLAFAALAFGASRAREQGRARATSARETVTVPDAAKRSGASGPHAVAMSSRSP